MPRTRRAAAGAEPAKRSERETVINLRLPRELHARLKRVAGNRTFTTEVRRRLETSLTGEPASHLDPKTRQLVAGIAGIAEFFNQPPERLSALLDISPQLEPWHTDPVAFAGLREAIDRFLRFIGPRHEPPADRGSTIKNLAGAAVMAGIGKIPLDTITEPPGEEKQP